MRSAATAYDSGAPAAEITQSAAMAKLFATESAQWVVDQAVQLHGARGLQRGHLLERLYREVRAPRIYEGASEVQRTIIGRGLVRAHDQAEEGNVVTRYRGSVPITDDWQHFRFAVADGVATVTLNRPEKMNPLTFECVRRPARPAARAPAPRRHRRAGDPRRGPGVLRRRRRQRDHRRADHAWTPHDLIGFTQMTGDVIKAMRECPIPIVAGIQGIAAGAGVGDRDRLRLPGLLDVSARFAFLFTKVGLSGGDMGAAYLLPRLVGAGRATELLMLGDTIDAETADRYGLVSAAGRRRRARRRPWPRSPGAWPTGPRSRYAQTKSLITRELDMPIGAAMELDAMTQALLMTTTTTPSSTPRSTRSGRREWTGR